MFFINQPLLLQKKPLSKSQISICGFEFNGPQKIRDFSLNHLLLRLFVLKFQALDGLKSNAKADDSNFISTI